MTNRTDAYARGYQAAQRGEPATESLKFYKKGYADAQAGKRMSPLQPSGRNLSKSTTAYLARAMGPGGLKLSPIPISAASARSLEAGVKIYGTRKAAVDAALRVAFPVELATAQRTTSTVSDLKCSNCGGVPESRHLDSWRSVHTSSQLRACLKKMGCKYSGVSDQKLDAAWENNAEYMQFATKF